MSYISRNIQKNKGEMGEDVEGNQSKLTLRKEISLFYLLLLILTSYG